jgi:hypothetical protein
VDSASRDRSSRTATSCRRRGGGGSLICYLLPFSPIRACAGLVARPAHLPWLMITSLMISNRAARMRSSQRVHFQRCLFTRAGPPGLRSLFSSPVNDPVLSASKLEQSNEAQQIKHVYALAVGHRR